MQDLSPEQRHELDELARRYGVGLGTVQALHDALMAGGGSMAQFDIPELGGMGQWSQGGMTMVGDMFDQSLKARVSALCSDLASLSLMHSRPAHHDGTAQDSGSVRPAGATRAPFGQMRSQLQGGGQPTIAPGTSPGAAPSGGGNWWPAELGTPSSSGAQNDVRYAYFPDVRRLAIQQDGRLSLYDTGEHRIGGVSQQQGGTRSLTFTSQHGPVSLDSLPPVASGESRPAPSAHLVSGPSGPSAPAPAPAPPAASSRPAAGVADDPLTKIERLAELRQKGVLTEEEFAAAKAEQLRRL